LAREVDTGWHADDLATTTKGVAGIQTDDGRAWSVSVQAMWRVGAHRQRLRRYRAAFWGGEGFVLNDFDDIPPLPLPDPNDPVMRAILEAQVRSSMLERALSMLPRHEQDAYDRWERQRVEILKAFQVVSSSDDEREIFAASRMISADLCRWALEGRRWRKFLSEVFMRLPPEPIPRRALW
jgi:hypothetical protein